MNERDHYDFDPEGAMERGDLHQLDLIYFSLKGDRRQLMQQFHPSNLPYVYECIDGLTPETEEILLHSPASKLSPGVIIETIKLARIDRALNRYRTALYSFCINCGKKIPLARLKIHPTAERCLPCQKAFEEETCF